MIQDEHGAIEAGLHTGFIDGSRASSPALRPRLITNNRISEPNVLKALLYELKNCTSFDIAVAFINRSGIAALFQVLLELEQAGITGRILTTDYLDFNEPEALHVLMDIPSLSVRVLHGNLHTKGYLFYRNDDSVDLIVGSANLTSQALSINHEWNLKVTSTSCGETVHHIRDEFNCLWEQAHQLSPAWLAHYELRRKAVMQRFGWMRFDESGNLLAVPAPNTEDELRGLSETVRVAPIPNSMQSAALTSLAQLRNKGERKALIVSATGTGKTHLAAFDARSCAADRLLYIVHRETILRESMKTFKRVFGNDRPIDFGILGGGVKEIDADYVFASITTLAKPEVLHQFDEHHFDYIIVDEVHRAGAESYRRVLDHFTSGFVLGMTATPERTDGQDIYALFDHNVAYTIRLQQAMEQGMLCPFHYFGITDLTVDGTSVNDTSETVLLASEQRARHLLQAIETYSMHEKRKRGLIFCRSVQEARELSIRLNEMGLKTLAITGEDPEAIRESALKRLQTNHSPDMLEYLVTVDIFNEGIDIPNLNQIVMARPTQSAIIFMQQLGRGLRTYTGKSFLTVIDFVGNYSNNYLIPIALYGDVSYSKDRLRKFMISGELQLNGESTISFDRIARQRIFEAINSATLNTKPVLKQHYLSMKERLGRIPTLMDFIEANEFDPLVFFSKFNSYPLVVKEFEHRSDSDLNRESMASLNFISQELANGKRVHELVLLRMLSSQQHVTLQEFKQVLHSECGVDMDGQTCASVVRILSNGFFTAARRKTFADIGYVDVQGDRLSATARFQHVLSVEAYRKAFDDVLSVGLAIHHNRYDNEYRQEDGLVLYERYSRKDVCRILNWEKNEESTIYGYKIKHGTCPIFVTYHKRDDINPSIAYQDGFSSREEFSWMTRSRVSLASSEAQQIMNQQASGLRMYLFVKKSDAEGYDFHFLGQIDHIKDKERQTVIQDKKGAFLPIVNFQFALRHSCRNDVYEYLIEEASDR